MVLWKKQTAAALAAVFVGLLGTGSAVFAEAQISQGVSIGGMDVSGMTYSEAEAVVEQKVSEMQNSTITVKVGENTVEATAVDLGLQWKNRDVVEEAMALGNSGNIIKRYKDTKDLAQGSRELALEFSANDTAVRNFVENTCRQYEQEPVEASISSDGAGGINLQVGEDGLAVNVEESVQILEDFIANDWSSGTSTEVSVSVEIEEPEASEEDLETITDCLGTYTTYYGSTVGRNTNVERGAELINGHLIMPGESFSVCDALVPFTAENGYELGGAYENGQVVQEYGGGICQVSTTLYNALLLAEIEIVERHNHTMSVSYVPTSMDAAIAEGSMDLVFCNNLDTPIFISGYAYGGVLTFSVWGQETRPADRTIYYESETTSTIEAPTTTILSAVADQAVGYFSQVQYAAPGSTAVLYKYVTYNGETTVEQVNSSTYEATTAVYEVGTMGASDALLTAIYNNDLAAAQLAATGTTTQTETDATTDTTGTDTTTQTDAASTDTSQTDSSVQTDGSVSIYTDGTTTDGYIDTTDGEVYVGDTTDSTYTDGTYTGSTYSDDTTSDSTYSDGTVTW